MAFASILAATLATQPADPVHWRCLHYRQDGDTTLHVSRSLDADGRPLFDRVMWMPRTRTGDGSVSWQRRDPIESATLPWTLRTDSIQAQLTLSRAAWRPVWLVLRVDGRIVGRRLLFRQMSDLDPYDRQQLRIWGIFSDDGPDRGPVPDLADASGIVVTAEEEGGETLASTAIPLPSAAIVQEMIAQVAPALAAIGADYRTLCRDVSLPIPVPPPMPAPPRPAG